MYKRIDKLPELLARASDIVIENDRSLYLPFYEALEHYCKAHNVVLGGRIGLHMIAGGFSAREHIVWDLYIDGVFAAAKHVADALLSVRQPHIASDVIALKTELRDSEYIIYVNARPLARIFTYGRGVSVAESMAPMVRESIYAKVLTKCMSAEMQLIEVYRVLYSPAKFAMFADYFVWEQLLYKHVNTTAALSQTGGAGSRDGGASGADTSVRALARETPELMRKLMKNPARVLVGDFAMISHGIPVSNPRIQILTSDDIDEICKEVERSCARVRMLKITNGAVTAFRHNLNIMTDFRLAKHTIYYNTGRDRVSLLDVFNCPAHELIPYTIDTNGVKIGNLWVLLRFAFINIWVMKIIANTNALKSTFVHARTRAILANANTLRELLMRNTERLFQLDNYIGIHSDENVAKKKVIKETGQFFPTYYPTAAAGSADGGGDAAVAVAPADTPVPARSALLAHTDTKRSILAWWTGIVTDDIDRAVKRYCKDAREYMLRGTPASDKILEKLLRLHGYDNVTIVDEFNHSAPVDGIIAVVEYPAKDDEHATVLFEKLVRAARVCDGNFDDLLALAAMAPRTIVGEQVGEIVPEVGTTRIRIYKKINAKDSH